VITWIKIGFAHLLAKEACMEMLSTNVNLYMHACTPKNIYIQPTAMNVSVRRELVDFRMTYYC
jgi:hypothetical protein